MWNQSSQEANVLVVSLCDHDLGSHNVEPKQLGENRFRGQCVLPWLGEQLPGTEDSREATVLVVTGQCV